MRALVSQVLFDDILYLKHIALDLSYQIELITRPVQIMSISMDFIIYIAFDVIS